MNVLLEAYLERNFGDDLFVTLLIDHYQEHQFYLLDDQKKGFALANESKFKNLCMITEQEAMENMQKFGAYVLVGGDFYWPYSEYHGRVQRAKAIHEKDGNVLILGGSLYKTYPPDRLPFVQEFFRYVDVITLRDSTSYAQCETLMPDSCALLTSDMAFTLIKEHTQKRQTEVIHNLGISVRQKADGTRKQFEIYCKTIADAASAHLKKDPKNTVCFLALSTSGFDDRDVIDQIRYLMPQGMENQITEVEYSRNVFRFIDAVDACDALICTRFHSLCLALILGKPFFPINYEAKVENLLKDIGFKGVSVDYGVYEEPDVILQALKQNAVDEQKFSEYEERAKRFFEVSDIFLDGEGMVNEEYGDALRKVTRRLHEEQARCDREKAEQDRKPEAQEVRFQQNVGDLKADVAELSYWLDVAGRSKPLKLGHFLTHCKHALIGTPEEKADSRRWLRGDRSFVPKHSYLHQSAICAARISRKLDLFGQDKQNRENVQEAIAEANDEIL